MNLEDTVLVLIFQRRLFLHKPQCSLRMVSRQIAFTGIAILSSLIFASGVPTATSNTNTTKEPSHEGSAIGTAIPTTAPKHWVHPGVFVSDQQLSFVKHKVKAGAQPWAEAFAAMLADPLASTTRAASPRPTVDCGASSNPNHGCSDERNDAMAAYMNALAYYIADNTQYAKKAIFYMNAWSSTIKDHTNANAHLQAGWAAAEWVRAGELILHSKASKLWAAAEVAAFQNMLRSVYIPAIIHGTKNDGNQELG